MLVALVPASGVAQPADPAIPSAADVELGRAQARTAAARVGRIEAGLSQAQERLDQAGAKAAAVFEAYNAAVYRLDGARAAAAAARAAHRAAVRAQAESREEIGRLAALSYRSGGDIAGLATVLDAERPAAVLDRATFVSYLGRRQQVIYHRSRRASANAERARHGAETALRAQQRAAEQVRVAKDRAQAQVRVQRSQQLGMSAERDRLLAELARAREAADLVQQRRTAGLAELRQAAERAAAERRAAERRARERAERQPRSTPSRAPVAPADGAERAVSYAYQQIGKPYEWAAAGPDSFDCSGLTMRAWERGGVQLPHWSVAQYEQTQRVGLAELRRGDLVFFASDKDDHGSIYHVGLYVGDGRMIEAPYTGENVRESSIWRASLFGAGRPA
jgi:cell wall-associated NlpC family hydrolase